MNVAFEISQRVLNARNTPRIPVIPRRRKSVNILITSCSDFILGDIKQNSDSDAGNITFSRIPKFEPLFKLILSSFPFFASSCICLFLGCHFISLRRDSILDAATRERGGSHRDSTEDSLPSLKIHQLPTRQQIIPTIIIIIIRWQSGDGGGRKG